MSEYTQEAPEVYGDQIHVTNRLNYQFARIPHALILAIPVIGRDAFLTYSTLMYWADGTGVCWPSIARLRHLTGFGRNRLFKALRTLVKYNILERSQMRKGKEFGANRYVILPIEEWDNKALLMESPKWVSPESASPEQGHKLDPVLTRSSLNLDPEEHTQNARACEGDASETEGEEQTVRPPRALGRRLDTGTMVYAGPKDEEQTVGYGGEEKQCTDRDPLTGHRCLDTAGHTGRHQHGGFAWDPDPMDTVQPTAPAGYGEELEERQCPYCDELFFGMHDCCGEDVTSAEPDPMDTLQPTAPHAGDLGSACQVYHAGFPCAHEQFALGEIARIVWGKKPTEHRLKSHPSLHAYIHDHEDLVGPPDDWELVAINHVRELATWWRANRKPKDWSIPLMFSRPEETLATAQSQDDPSARPLTTEEERAREKTKRMVARIDAENEAKYGKGWNDAGHSS